MGKATPGIIANTAVRIFLKRVGKRYDAMRGRAPYSDRDRAQVVNDFGGACSFCETPLVVGKISDDHLIPINQTSLGLHAWGNVVRACSKCNGDKREADWREYVRTISPTEEDFTRRVSRIEAFQDKYGYAPGVGLKIAAETLHAEVGAQTMMLIEAKLESAELLITRLGKSDVGKSSNGSPKPAIPT